jgi:hypothetical protein
VILTFKQNNRSDRPSCLFRSRKNLKEQKKKSSDKEGRVWELWKMVLQKLDKLEKCVDVIYNIVLAGTPLFEVGMRKQNYSNDAWILLNV